MAKGDFEKYIIRSPRFEDLPFGAMMSGNDKRGGKTKDRIFSSANFIPGAKMHIDAGWIFEIPTPNPYIDTHTHDVDEILFFIGTDPDDIDNLHGEAEVFLDGHNYLIDTTCAIYVPAGVEHCPIKYNRVDRPHQFMSILLNGTYTGSDQNGFAEAFLEDA
ncbi:cupin domain-containing protein [Cucumibacter marinus]|uniref:hypothetical protein n=1 Tax=Cucumibacter marinus TaxID=1121252 RepID=UPI000419EB01|nr:hypothetical protein [Cucumibacter marinus]